MATSKVDDSKNKAPPQLMVLDRSFKLAEQWVNNMSKPKSSVNEKPDVPLEARPPRLGIGATLKKDSKFSHSSDNPVERKLYSMLNAGKKKARLIEEEDLAPPAKKDEESSDEEESESRTRAISKSKPRNFTWYKK